ARARGPPPRAPDRATARPAPRTAAPVDPPGRPAARPPARPRRGPAPRRRRSACRAPRAGTPDIRRRRRAARRGSPRRVARRRATASGRWRPREASLGRAARVRAALLLDLLRDLEMPLEHGQRVLGPAVDRALAGPGLRRELRDLVAVVLDHQREVAGVEVLALERGQRLD